MATTKPNAAPKAASKGKADKAAKVASDKISVIGTSHRSILNSA